MTPYLIKRLGSEGDGIADGPIYANRTLPGETVTGDLAGNRVSAPKIVKPSEHRVAAPCPHYKGCGGCQLLHASDPFTAQWKTDLIRGALSAHGITTGIRPIVTTPGRDRRRAVFAARRTKKGATAGFYGVASDVIAQINDCQLVQPEVQAALPIAKALAVTGTSRKAALAVTATHSDAGLDLSVQGGKPLDGNLQKVLADLANAHKLARLCWNDDVIVTRHQPIQYFDDIAVVPPPGAFLQATMFGEKALRRAVSESISRAGLVADLFAGCGTFSLPAARSAQVHAVESDAAMTNALDAAWRNTEGLKPVTTESRDLFRRPLLPDELAKFDAVIIDPPRAGAAAQVAELAKSGVSRVAFVSCNPITFARDAKVVIDAGFSLDWVQSIDQFRWSTHVELAAQVSRST